MSEELPPLSEAFQRRYTISRQLGAGGMGGVYLAHDEELGRPVAIKFLHSFSESRDSLAGQRFEEEARVCAQLKHPRIVGLYALDWEGQVPYLVFEYVAGESLAGVIYRQDRLTVETTLSLGQDLFAALAAAHELGVVHRDVKPANILVRASDGHGMLADFGLARSSGRTSFQTAKNLVLGTPAFMAPEVLRGEAAGPAADLYAAGCTLYACLAGEPPFVGETELKTMELQLKAAPAPLAGVPAELDALVGALLAKDAPARPASAAAAAAALAKIAASQGLAAASGQGLPVLPRPRTRERLSRTAAQSRPAASVPLPRRRGWLVPSLAVAVGLGAGAWWWAARGRVVGPRVLVTGGQATITWETPRDTRGRVVVREDVPGGRTEELWENAPGRMHSASVRDLKAGVPIVAGIVLAGEEPAWTARFTPPPPLVAKLAGAGPGAARVTVTSAPADLTLALAGAHEGESIAAAQPGLFEIRHGAAQLSAGARLERALAPGVVASWPVETVPELAARLAGELDGFRPGPLVAKLVMNRAFDPWVDFGASLGTFQQFAHGDLDRKAAPPPKSFYPLVEAEARALELWADVEAFRSEADGYWSEPSIPDAAKLHLYRGLLKLEPFDQLCAAQHDTRNLRVRALYAGLVRTSFSFPAPPSTGGLFPLTSWNTVDFFDWSGAMWWTEKNPTVCTLHPDLAWDDLKALKQVLRTDRTATIPGPDGAGGPGTAELTATVCHMGPSYHFEVALGDLPILLTQPGTEEWFAAMDKLPPGWDRPPPVAERTFKVEELAWGQMRVTFPARLLPPGPLPIRVSYQHVPGVPLNKLSNVQRLAHVREITLRVNSAPR